MFDDADWADYEIPGVEQGNSGLYEFEFPAELGAESYLVEIRLREVSAPTAALTDKRVSGIIVRWDGTDVAPSTLDEVVDGLTVRQTLEIIMAVLVRETDVLAADRVQFKNSQGTVVVDTVYDENRGKRLVVTITPTE